MKWVVGIDEVGRGALAGPVVVAAALLPRTMRIKNRGLGALKDSKKLTAARREAWLGHFKKDSDVRFVVARIYPRGIEKMNISGAANLAAHRAFARLCEEHGLAPKECVVYLDGGLFLKSRAYQTDHIKTARTLVKADEKISAVKAASIIAKVTRDRFMKKLSKKYPAYGFDIHKGYGTRAHLAVIRRKGPSETHRLTFIGGKYTL